MKVKIKVVNAETGESLPYATVWLDGTPKTVGGDGVAEYDIDPGVHELKVRATGYEPYGSTDVHLEEPITYTIDLRRARI